MERVVLEQNLEGGTWARELGMGMSGEEHSRQKEELMHKPEGGVLPAELRTGKEAGGIGATERGENSGRQKDRQRAQPHKDWLLLWDMEPSQSF